MDEKKKILEAVALEYNESKDAPVVVAAGKGAVAEHIIEKAQEHGVPIHQDAQLAHTLNQLEIGKQIPPELYAVVAQILVYVREMDERVGRRKLAMND